MTFQIWPFSQDWIKLTSHNDSRNVSQWIFLANNIPLINVPESFKGYSGIPGISNKSSSKEQLLRKAFWIAVRYDT